MTSKTSVCKYS